MGIVEAKKVFENFESIEEDFECIGLESGHINETYLIRNKKKKYILQKINSSIFPNLETIHSNIEIVAKHLESKNYAHKRIELLPFSNGKTIWENEWRIMHFIGNSIGFEKVNSANQCYEAAVFLSDFHSNLLDLDTKKIQNPLPNFLNYEDRWHQFVMSVDFASKDRLAEALPEIEFLYAHRFILDEWINLQPELPLRIIHGDPKISNFLFDEMNSSKIIAIIDWDTLMPGTILYDFADMVRSYSNLKEEDDPSVGKNFSQENYLALEKGFLKHLNECLEPIEKNNLKLAAKSIIYIQALRFLTDFLNQDVYYKINYPIQNLNRAKNQINLLKSLLN